MDEIGISNSSLVHGYENRQAKIGCSASIPNERASVNLIPIRLPYKKRWLLGMVEAEDSENSRVAAITETGTAERI